MKKNKNIKRKKGKVTQNRLSIENKQKIINHNKKRIPKK